MKDIDKKHIEIIKNSFEEFKFKAPDKLWDDIDKKLYIERIWNKLKVRLDAIQYERKIKKIVLFFLVLLILVTVNINRFLKKEKSLIPQAVVLKSSQNSLKKDYLLSKLENDSSNRPSHYSEKNNFKKKNTKQLVDNSILLNKEPSKVAALINEINDATVDTIKALDSKLVTTLIVDPFMSFPNINFDIKFGDPKVYYNEIGIIVSFFNTNIINNDYKESQRENGFVNLMPVYKYSIGILYDHNISYKNSINTELFFSFNQNQKTYLYKNGKYFQKTIDLSYTKIALSFERKFLTKNINSWFSAGVGGYFALLNNDKMTYKYKDIVVNNYSGVFKKIDYGIKMSINREYNYHRIIAGLGLHYEYGLNNIFKGNQELPSYFDYSNNINFGVDIFVKFKN